MRWRAPGLDWLLVGVCLAWAQASAQTAQVENSQTASKTSAAHGIDVSMEFLEFLGEWEAGNGEWVDPAELDSADWPAATDDSADRSDKETGNAQ